MSDEEVVGRHETCERAEEDRVTRDDRDEHVRGLQDKGTQLRSEFSRSWAKHRRSDGTKSERT